MLRTNGGNRGCVIINILIFGTNATKKYKIYLKFYQNRNQISIFCICDYFYLSENVFFNKILENILEYSELYLIILSKFENHYLFFI